MDAADPRAYRPEAPMRRSISLVTLLAVSLLTASAGASPDLPIQRKVQTMEARLAHASKQKDQLRGLSQGPVGTLAFWRDRSLRTPEVRAAIQTLRSYMKAYGKLYPSA